MRRGEEQFRAISRLERPRFSLKIEQSVISIPEHGGCQRSRHGLSPFGKRPGRGARPMNCRHASRFLMIVGKDCHNHKLSQSVFWQNEPNFLLAVQWDGIQRFGWPAERC